MRLSKASSPQSKEIDPRRKEQIISKINTAHQQEVGNEIVKPKGNGHSWSFKHSKSGDAS